MKNVHADSVETSVGIVSNQKSSFNIYPNPANDIINISYKSSLPLVRRGGSRLIISDLNGRTVKEFQLNPAQTKISADTNDLLAGVYIIEIKSDGKS